MEFREIDAKETEQPRKQISRLGSMLVKRESLHVVVETYNVS